MTAYQQVMEAWNAQAGETNQWGNLGEDEKIEWALKCADQFRDPTKMMQAARQALEALEKCNSALAEELAAWDIDPPLHHVLEASNACAPAITALREALEAAPADSNHDAFKLGYAKGVDDAERRAKARGEQPVAVEQESDDIGVQQDKRVFARIESIKKRAPQPARQPLEHDEDLLEQLYWEFDDRRQKTGEERLAFKGKMRFYASEVLKKDHGIGGEA